MNEHTLRRSVTAWLTAEERAGRLLFAKLHGGAMSRAGLPDYVIFLHGRVTLLIELKAGGGEMTHLQTHIANKLLVLGHSVRVCRSLADVKHALAELMHYA